MNQKLALAVMIATLSGTAWAAGGTSSSAEEAQSQGTQSGAVQQEQGQEQAQEQSTPMDIGSDGVRKVQQALKEAGHDPGKADGIWGPETQEAVRDFQQAQGLEATGDLNEETLAALGLGTLPEEKARSAKPTEPSTPTQPEVGQESSPEAAESSEAQSQESSETQKQ